MRRPPSDARRALLPLSGGVGTDRRALHHYRGVDDDVVARDLHREAVHAARRRTPLLLADPVVLRAVARALEPLRGLAPRDTAAEVRALLVEGDVALGHPGQDAGLVPVDLLRLRQRVLRVRLDVHLGAGVVEGLLLVEGRLDVARAADGHLGAGAAGRRRPEEGEGGGAEAAHAEGEAGEHAA